MYLWICTTTLYFTKGLSIPFHTKHVLTDNLLAIL